jgi:phosphoglycerol transferase
MRDEVKSVKAIESILPPGSAVLQLPFTDFPAMELLNKMESYDHARPFLWAQSLKWSWPSFSTNHRHWQDRMKCLSGSEFLNAAIYSGFDAIWIDKFAYNDNGIGLIKQLDLDGAVPISISSSRYYAIDIRKYGSRLKDSLGSPEFAAQKDKLLLPPRINVVFSTGFYDREKNQSGQSFNWSKQNSKLIISNNSKINCKVKLKFLVATANIGQINIDNKVICTSTTPQKETIEFNLIGNEQKTILFKSSTLPINTSIDPRDLHFYIMNLNVE